MAYSILTPFLVPYDIKRFKKCNIGDGFILRSILRLLYPEECKYIYSSRKELQTSQIKKINSTKALVLAGANQLNDHFTVLPNMTLSKLQEIKVPIILSGIGISGHKSQTICMSEETRETIREIHKRTRYSSWRCFMTVDYLSQNLPELTDKFIMTGCPVGYGDKLLNGEPFSMETNNIVVTVTERGDFWEREISTIDFVHDRFQNSRKVLSLHQFFAPTIISKLNDFINSKRDIHSFGKRVTELHQYAKSKGFEIFVPRNVDECLSFYDTCDLHFGSRLHAHLYFLSQSKRSFLTYVDDRMTGISQSMGFPLCDYLKFEKYLNYNFEEYRKNCIHYYKNMIMFVEYLKTEIL